MSNLRIINQNVAKLATLTASTEAGSLVVENLQDDRKGIVWRSTANTATTITAEWTDAQFVNAVVLPFCNLTSTATMQVELFTNVADVTPVYDSGAVVCCGYSSFDFFNWGAAPLGVNAFSVGGGTYARVYTDINPVKKVVITIIDTDNASAYIESGCLVIGKYWSPTYNAAYGANIAVNTTNKIDRSHAGDSILTQGTMFKSLDFNLEWLEPTDMDYVSDMLKVNQAPVFISIYPEDTDITKEQNAQIYGRVSPSGYSQTFLNNDASSISIEEV